MKILQVTPRYPPHTGGVETHVRQISERLVERGHEVTVVAADRDSDVARRERRNGVDVRRHRALAPGGAFHVAPGVLPAVARAEADVVHAHNYHSLPLLFAAAASGETPFGATTHYHGASANRARNALLRLYRAPGGRALRRADRVFAVSEWERDRLRAAFGVAATVIPNGLDVRRFREASPVTRDRPYLLCVGRLVEYKGVQHALRALTHLPAYDLLVAGTGPYQSSLERLAASLGLEDRVEFLGFVAEERLPGLYAGAAAHVTLSSFESYGMTVAESLAAGTPCVVRRARALTEWARREGCIGVTDVSPGAVSDAVDRAVGRTPSTDGLLTWDEVVDRVEEEYRALLCDGEVEGV